jgi:hypothetical protein
LISLDQRLDLSMLVRSISPAYVSLNSSAFTESGTTGNETGVYAGISLRPNAVLRLDAYADIFYFPWLRYRVDAPSIGKDFLIQFTYQPSKRFSLNGRWKSESKETNLNDAADPTTRLADVRRGNLRIHWNWDCNRIISLRQRWETSAFTLGHSREEGFLLLHDLDVHPAMKPYDFSCRLLFFESGGYDSRIYAFENNVQSGFSVPAFYGKGIYTSFNGHINLTRYFKKQFRKINAVGFWLSVSQTLSAPAYQDNIAVDNMGMESKLLVRLQFIVKW